WVAERCGTWEQPVPRAPSYTQETCAAPQSFDRDPDSRACRSLLTPYRTLRAARHRRVIAVFHRSARRARRFPPVPPIGPARFSSPRHACGGGHGTLTPAVASRGGGAHRTGGARTS